jgi:carbonic anhydrase
VRPHRVFRGAPSAFKSLLPCAVLSCLARIHRLLPVLFLSLGCDKLLAKDPDPPAGEASKIEASSEAHAEGDEKKEAEGEHGQAPTRPGRYGVPFAWEISPEEPLAKARTFMAEVLETNARFVGQGKSQFTPFVDAETPRATVLTCSDSRVQASAWDATPENDDYTVRNLGNQLSTALGSVEYGVDRLHTPVLLIVGHTGCEAVKAALEKKDKGKGPIADELSHLELPERHRRAREHDEWSSLTQAVVANVDTQVADAVAHFAPHVQSGELTVVGAVYDFQNEFDGGHGRLRLVNVNSNIEPARIDAFQEAVKAGNKSKTSSLGQRRSPNPMSALIDRTGRPLPGGPRATIDAVSVLGSGDFDAIAGTLRQPALRPGSPVPGTTDLKVARGYRPPAAATPTTTDAQGTPANNSTHEEAKTPGAAKKARAAAHSDNHPEPPEGAEHPPSGSGH